MSAYLPPQPNGIPWPIFDSIQYTQSDASVSISYLQANYLPLIGGTLTGNLFANSNIFVANSLWATFLTGTLQTAAQPNITSHGTLISSLKTLVSSSLSVGCKSSNSTQITNSSFTDTYDMYLKRNTANLGDTIGIAFLATTNAAATLPMCSIVASRVGLSAGHLIFNTTSVERMRISSTGVITTNLTMDSSSTTVGSVVLAGGLAVAKNIHSLNYYGMIQTTSQPNITSLGTLTGLTMGGSINVNGYNVSSANAFSSVGIINLSNTSAATNNSNGSVQMAGD